MALDLVASGSAMMRLKKQDELSDTDAIPLYLSPEYTICKGTMLDSTIFGDIGLVWVYELRHASFHPVFPARMPGPKRKNNTPWRIAPGSNSLEMNLLSLQVSCVVLVLHGKTSNPIGSVHIHIYIQPYSCSIFLVKCRQIYMGHTWILSKPCFFPVRSFLIFLAWMCKVDPLVN